ncbi:MAG: response regulator [Anaerolineales bacterium]
MPESLKNIDRTKLILDLFELSPSATAVFNRHTGICLTHNRAFSTQLGIPDAQLDSGKLLFQDLFSNAEEAVEFLDLLTTRSAIRRHEVSLLDNEGRSFHVFSSGRMLNKDYKNLFEFSFTDISKQKQLQNALKREHARMFSLIDNVTAGLFLINNSGKITEANLAVSNILQVSQNELIGKKDQYIINHLISKASEPEVLQKSLSTAILNIIEKPVLEFEFQENEKVYHYELALFPVRDENGTPLGWGGLMQDITALREQAAWKLDLLSILSHDIRSPLATLKGHATALLGNYQSWGSDMVQEFLEVINQSTDELINQVERNLALTRIDTGRLGLRPQAAQPHQLVKHAIERSASVLENMPVDPQVPEDLPNVRVDPARIEEVLINLIENAAKYAQTPQGILIGSEEKDTHVDIFVQDFGPGISRDKQEKIFQKFERGESKKAGSGLGLFISKKIIEDHGGAISLMSPPPGEEKGSRFTISLPKLVQMPQTQPAESGFEESESMVPPLTDELLRILIVDDQPDFQTLYRAILPEDEFDLEFASDGRTALEISQVSSPDLILLDWILPDMEGISVCRQIRRWSEVPILMVTSRSAQEDVISALDAGADDYLTKPFLGDELLARIRAVLRRGETLKTSLPENRFSKNGLVIDYDTREVWKSGKKLQLTATEFELLAYFFRNQRRILKYDQLINRVWKDKSGGNRHALSVHISRLRKKIETDPDNPEFLVTRWGVGYVFLPDKRQLR